MRIRSFAKRNFIEMLREPLSYMMCLGFPIVMLLIMHFVNQAIPAQANMTLFQIQNIGPAITIFGFTFVMLFTCLCVAGDRSNAFLIRLYASPMIGTDFIIGYTVPMVVISLLQCIITLIAVVIFGLMSDYHFQLINLLLVLIFLLPSMIMYVSFGLLFGTLFNEKAAPGLCSIIISACGIVGGIWMDVSMAGKGFFTFCKALPFYHSVNLARMVAVGNIKGSVQPLLITIIYAIAVSVIAILVYRAKMQNDLK